MARCIVRWWEEGSIQMSNEPMFSGVLEYGVRTPRVEFVRSSIDVVAQLNPNPNRDL